MIIISCKESKLLNISTYNDTLSGCDNVDTEKQSKDLIDLGKDIAGETVLKVVSGLAIGLTITVLILGNIFSATDTAMTTLNDSSASAGYSSIKSYVWIGLPLLGVLIIVIVGRQLMDNT